jgi:hypothetical protein
VLFKALKIYTIDLLGEYQNKAIDVNGGKIMSDIINSTVEGDNAPTQEQESKIESKINSDVVSEWLETDEGRKFLQPLFDKKITQAIGTYKENTLPKLVEQEISSRFPAETPEQKQLRALQEKLDKMESTTQKEKLLNQAIIEGNNMGISPNITKYVLGNSIEETRLNLMTVQNEINSIVQKEVEQRLQGKNIKHIDSEKINNDPFLAAFNKKW